MKYTCVKEYFGGARTPIVRSLYNSEFKGYVNPSVNYPNTKVFSIKNSFVSDRGFLLDESRVPFFSVDSNRVFPGYVEEMYKSSSVYSYGEIKSLSNLDLSKLEVLTLPCAFSFIHFNLVYGHWLLEMFPKLLVLADLYKNGMKMPVILPTGIQSYVAKFIEEIIPEVEFFFFDSNRQIVNVTDLLIVSCDDLCWAGEWFSHQYENIFSSHHCDPVFNKKVFLVRPEAHKSRRVLSNEKELSSIAANYGFDIVDPSSLRTFAEQVNLFRSSNFIIGEFNSALHNTLFSKKANVLCFNYINSIQNEIAIFQQQKLGYLIPDGGPFSWDSDISYGIDLDIFNDYLKESLRA